MLELQADCYAGVWAHHANPMWRQQYGHELLEPGDVQEGLEAAATIGDDRLMRNAGRRASPESFTHGTSAQRVEWLRRGLETGDVDACDTFSRGR
jgi:predicted metalloprotease